MSELVYRRKCKVYANFRPDVVDYSDVVRPDPCPDCGGRGFTEVVLDDDRVLWAGGVYYQMNGGVTVADVKAVLDQEEK